MTPPCAALLEWFDDVDGAVVHIFASHHLELSPEAPAVLFGPSPFTSPATGRVLSPALVMDHQPKIE
jgi:hypothetical protein